MISEVDRWLSEDEKEALRNSWRIYPMKDMDDVCRAVFLISIVRNSRAPKPLEDMMVLSGSRWGNNYVKEFVLGPRKIEAFLAEVVDHEGYKIKTILMP